MADEKEVEKVEAPKEPTIKELLEHQKKLDANISGSTYEKKDEPSEKKEENKPSNVGGSASKSSPSPWAPQA